MLPDRKARLLLESSHASPPSSLVSFHNGTANLTDSTVSLLPSTTVLPSASTSLPPHDHRYGYQKALASPKACATVWPSGCPLAFSFLPASRHSSQVCGYFSASLPISSHHGARWAICRPTIVLGMASHFLPSKAIALAVS